MRLPQASPEDGGRNDYEHFTNWSIGCGEKQFGYVAGPCQWFVCHPSERSKPCLHWFTDKELPCKRCAQKKPTTQLGYLPLWRGSDWRPKFVILYPPEREHVAALKLHQRVMVFRESDRGSTLTIRPALVQEPPFVSTLAHRMRPQDIWEVLLTVWDIPELTSWVRCQAPAPADAVVPMGDEPVKSDGQPFAPEYRAAAKRYSGEEDQGGPSAETFDAVRDRLKKSAGRIEPSANGSHKPRPKG